MKAIVLALFAALGSSSLSLAADPPKNFVLHPEAKQVADVRFEDERGGRHALGEFRGRMVLLNLWATWCAPCREEMPTLDRLQAQLGGPDFEVVALSVDRSGVPAVRKFFEEIGVRNLTKYDDPSGRAGRDLGAVGLPVTLLIDRQGREVGRLTGPADWDSPEASAFIKSRLAKPTGNLARKLRLAGRVISGPLDKLDGVDP